jgi:hypothetical protein
VLGKVKGTVGYGDFLPFSMDDTNPYREFHTDIQVLELLDTISKKAATFIKLAKQGCTSESAKGKKSNVEKEEL